MSLESEDIQRAIKEAAKIAGSDRGPKISVPLKKEYTEVLRDAFCQLSEEAWFENSQGESFDERRGSTVISEFNRAINESAGETTNLQIGLEAMAVISDLCAHLKQLTNDRKKLVRITEAFSEYALAASNAIDFMIIEKGREKERWDER